MHRNVLPLLALAALAFTSACGGAQRSGPRPLGWSDALEAMPRDVAYGVAWDMDSAFQAPTSLQQSLQQLEELGADEELGALFEALIDPASVGLDPDGDAGMFSTAVFPVMLARVIDRELFGEFVAAQFDEIGLSYVDTVDRAGHAFDLYMDPVDDDLDLEFGFVDDYAVLRMRAPGDAWAYFPDDRFEAWLSGREAAAWMTGPRFDAARNRLRDDAVVTQIMTLDMARIADLVERVVTRLSDEDRAMGLSEDDAYDDAEHRQTCLDATDRFVADLPYIAAVSVRADVGELAELEGTMLLSISEALAGRLRPALLPVSSALAGASNDAIFYLDSGLEFAPLAAAVITDPRLDTCPGLIAGPASLADEIDDHADDIDRAAAQATGAGALALYGLELGGMIPTVDAALSFFSPDAVGMSDQLGQMMGSQGATASVDETAAVTTIEYNLVVMTLRVMQLADRLVLSIGDVPPGVTDAMARGEREGPVFFRAGLNGQRMLDLMRDVLAYAREAGAGAALDGTTAGLLEIYERIVSVEMEAVLGDNFIAVDSTSVMRAGE